MEKLRKYGPILLAFATVTSIAYLIISVVSQKYPMSEIPGADWAIVTSIFIALIMLISGIVGRIQVFNRSDIKDIKQGQSDLDESFNDKIEKRTKKDEEQDRKIAENEKDIELLKKEVKHMSDNQDEFKTFMKDQFKEFKDFILTLKIPSDSSKK